MALGKNCGSVGVLPRLALYQPDIPQNAGALLRLAACLGIALDVIEPCGFLWDDKRMRRAGMDYLDAVQVQRHSGFAAFDAARVTELGNSASTSMLDDRVWRPARRVVQKKTPSRSSQARRKFQARSQRTRGSIGSNLHRRFLCGSV